MALLLKLVLLLAVLVATAAGQAVPQCLTVGLVSDNMNLPAQYLLVQLALNSTLRDGRFKFLSETQRGLQADVIVRVRPDYAEAPFHIAVQVSRANVSDSLEVVSQEITDNSKERIVGQIARAILTLCPTERVQAPIVTPRKPVTSAPIANQVLAAQPCKFQRIDDISLFSTSRSLDEQQLQKAIAKDPMARKLELRTDLPPGTGVQFTIYQELNSFYWSVVAATPQNELCSQSLFILRDHDVTRRLAHMIALMVAGSRGPGEPLGPKPVRSPRAFKIEARSGIPQVAEAAKLYIRIEQKDIVVTQSDGVEVKRIPSDSLLDVSVININQPIDSSWEDLSGAAADPASVMIVGGYVAVSSGIAFIRHAFATEHTLDLVWKDGPNVRQVSFKIRGRDHNRLRDIFERTLEVALVKSTRGTGVQ